MTKKLPISPDTCYMLGIYRCNSRYSNLCLESENLEIIGRFVKIAVMDLDTKREAVGITKRGEITKVEIKNSKLKKLLDNALDTRDRIFKYKNEYSASYFAAMFDCNGAFDRRGISISGLNSYDKIILERIGFHTSGKGYIRKTMDFLMFIEPFSVKARKIRHLK